MPNPPIYREGDHDFIQTLKGAPRELPGERTDRHFKLFSGIFLALIIVFVLGTLAFWIRHRIIKISNTYHNVVNQSSSEP